MMLTGESYFTVGTATPRATEVERLRLSFIDRGVAPHTARAWAEAEVPENFGYWIWPAVATSGRGD